MTNEIGRVLILVLPLLTIAAFWTLAAFERRSAGHPAERGFFRQNGVAVSIYLLVAVGVWSLVMIVVS